MRKKQPEIRRGNLRHERRGFIKWLRYCVAALSVAVLAGLRALLDPILGSEAPFVVFYGAIAVATYFGGLGPGLLALVLGMFAANLLFVPAGLVSLQQLTAAGIAIHIGYVAVGLMICLTGEALRRATARARSTAKELEEANERLCRVLESTTDGVKLIDANGRLAFINRQGRKMLAARGISPDACIGKPVFGEMFPQVKDSHWAVALRRALNERVFVEVEDFYEPWKRWYSSRFYPTKEGGVAIFFRDITERRDFEKALTNANTGLETKVRERTAELRTRVAELEELSYSIAHDLRAPLRSMHTCAHYLLEEYGERLGPTAHDYTRRMMAGAERMDKLLLDVLAYSRVMGAELALGAIDTERLIRGILEGYPEFQASSVEIQIEGKFPMVLANEAVLTQIISSIIDNGIKFVAPGAIPRVRIWAEDRGDRVRLWFADNGIGIEKEYQERIFEMFQRLDKSYPGTGAGLAVARKSAARMGGEVGVESEPGRGSRFWVELRRAERPRKKNVEGFATAGVSSEGQLP